MASVVGASASIHARPCQATTKISGVRSASPFSQGRSNLSFKLRPAPGRLTITCAKKETVDKVCDIVKKQLSLAEGTTVSAETKFTELGADSLDTVEIVMGLEEEFEITMEEDKAQKIATVEQAADLIEELVEAKNSA